MTPADFARRATDDAKRAGNGVALDPITLIVIAAALTAAVEYIVTHCLDWLTHHVVTSPNAAHRGTLRLWVVRPAVQKALRDAGHPPGIDRHTIEDRVVAGLLSAGQGLTEAEFASLKGSR